ncbi:MAG TPA: hypothetical protein VIM59_05650 [Cellvibrio sp.]
MPKNKIQAIVLHSNTSAGAIATRQILYAAGHHWEVTLPAPLITGSLN